MMARVECRCRWVVHSCSSESELHRAANVLKEESYLMWQTGVACGEAWVVVEPHPPSAFHRVELENAGSALVEMYGVRVDHQNDDGKADEGFEMLLPAQQIMTVRDLMHNSNRYRSFSYDVTHKLAPAAAQYRWRQIRIDCRQPLGTQEHRSCIGLRRVNIYPCKTDEELRAESTDVAAEMQKNKQLDEMFPTEIRVGERKVSQVTEPRNPAGVHYQSLRDDLNSFSGSQPVSNMKEKKRTLPVWLSSDIQKQGCEALVRSQSYNKEYIETKCSPEITALHLSKNELGADCKSSIEVLESKGETLISKEKRNENMPRFDVKLPESNHEANDANSSKSTETRNNVVANENKKSKLTFHANEDKRVKIEGSRKQQPVDAATEAEGGKNRKSNNNSKEGFDSTGSPRKGESTISNNMDANNRTEMKKTRTLITDTTFSNLLGGVVFAISGLVNPERAELRAKALEMGAEYRPDWCSDCTLLVCVFPNTPKFKQVKGLNGTIVLKDWILECHRQKELVEIDSYLLHAGKPWRHRVPNALETKEEIDEESEQNPSSSEGHVFQKGPEKQYIETLASALEIQKWAYEDRAASIEWLQQQNQQPDAEEIETVASKGIILCLEDTIKNLKKTKSVRNILENWAFVPRAVKEILSREGAKRNAKGHSRDSLIHAAEKLKSMYEKEFKKLEKHQDCSVNEQLVKKSEAEEDDDDDGGSGDDDDVTEVMSDDETDALDCGSDETVVMDEGCVRQAKQDILFVFRG